MAVAESRRWRHGGKRQMASVFQRKSRDIASRTKEFYMSPSLALLVVLATSSLSACSSQQLYSSGQAWQRNECNKIADAAERNRCMAGSNTSYEDYQRRTQAATVAR